MSELNNEVGFALLQPNRPIQAGEIGMWIVEYICGREKLIPGSTVRVTLPRIWSSFQLIDPTREGFTTVEIPSNIEYDLCVDYSQMAAAFQHLYIKIKKGGLSEGDVIKVIYGDTRFGSPGSRAQKIVENYFVKDEIWWGTPTTYFHIAIDPAGDGNFISLGDNHLWNPAIIPGKLWKLVLIGPSVLAVGESADFVLYGIDQFGNKVELEPMESICLEQGTVRYCNSPNLQIVFENGVWKINNFVFSKPGLYRLKIIYKDEIIVESNPVQIQVNPQKRIYWGDIHIHSNFCDGRKHPREIYQYCRDIARLDFASISSHDWGPLMDDEGWQQLQNITNQFNDLGKFVTLIGYEWTNWEDNGNRNVYYAGDSGPIMRYKAGSPKGLEEANVDERYRTAPQLWKALEGKEAIVIPHHSLAAMDNTISKEFEPVIEIYSCWGSSEYRGNPMWNNATNLIPSGERSPDKSLSVQDLLEKGHKLGFIAGSDNHGGMPGGYHRSPYLNLSLKGGLTGVITENLSRRNIFKALKNRHCYATTGARILLNFTVNGIMMGSALPYNKLESPNNVSFEVNGTDKIKLVELLKNNQTVCQWFPDRQDFKSNYVDRENSEKDTYYYLRVTQEDGEMAWSSPIWVEFQAQ